VTTVPTWTEIETWLGPTAPAFRAPATPPPSPQSLATDTRSLRRGDWFVPLSGESFDGHKFIDDAMGRGAAGFFYDLSRTGELPAALLPKGIAVTDTLAAMQHFATGWRSALKNLTLVALTGSTGKTTTKEMLGAVLKAAGPTLATQASFNNEIGVPKTLLLLEPAHRYAAVEFGARMPGNIKFLAELAHPDVVGLLNVGMTHVGIFGSIENLIATKLEIFRDSKPDARQVVFADDPRIEGPARATGKQTLTFGRDPKADVQVVKVDWQADGMRVELRVLGDHLSLRLGVAHEAFPINAAAAAALATAAGAPREAIVKGLEGFTGIKGRYQVHRQGARTVIDDTYNASPDSMRAGLQTLAKSFAAEKKVLILGDMLELGDCSAAEHRKVGALAAQARPERIITVGSDARHIAAGAQAEGFPAARIESFANVDDLLAANALSSKGGEVIYAKASHGIRLDRLVERLLKAGASA
jgi:UDP-N-acetylmuramoyl-tripeptide--D-alanyl-D-alanine ligase